MKPYFQDNQERLARLLHAAGTWMGTPWCANSDAKGEHGGVACHNLPRAILVEVGALPSDFPKVTGDPTGTRHKKEGVIEPFMDGRQEFQRLKAGESLQPGDVIGIRIYGCVDHMGIVLNEGMFLHVLMHKKTDADFTNVPPWQSRILAAWRPMEN